MPQQLTLQEFGATIKQKYPQYAQYSDEEIGRRMLAKYPQYQQNIREGMAGVQSGSSTTAYTPPGNTLGQVALNQAGSALSGMGQAVTQIPGAVIGLGSLAKTALTGSMPERIQAGLQAMQGMKQGVQSMVAPFVTATKGGAELAMQALPDKLQQYARPGLEMVAPGITQNVPVPETPEWTQAAEGGGTMLGNALLGYGLQKGVQYGRNFGNTAPASEKFDRIMAAAGDRPVDTWNIGNEVVRAEQLKQTGSSLPKVFSDYMRHQGPLDLRTSRDFAVNAGRLSAQEVQAANPVMQRQVTRFAKALNEANRETATVAGVGKLYDQAMKEYARAMLQQRFADALKELAKSKGAQIAIGSGTAYGIYRALAK